MAVNGVALGAGAIGAVLLYSALYDKSVLSSIKSVIAGKSPAAATSEAPQATGGLQASVEGSIVAPEAPADTTGNVALGKLLAAPFGWSTGSNWNSLYALWNKESGWNNLADNSSSGAYGIAQALPPTKYPYAGQQAGGSSAKVQILWGLAYVLERYGDPNNAWAHEVENNWY
jgi:hypothetical protein